MLCRLGTTARQRHNSYYTFHRTWSVMVSGTQVPAGDPADVFENLVTYVELLQTPKLARLYSFTLRHGPVTIARIKDELEMPHSTTYKYVQTLEDRGVLERDEEASPTRVDVESIHLHINTNDETEVATPLLVDAVGRQTHNEEIAMFVDRHGIPALAAALTYTLHIMEGDVTQGRAANELGVHPVEGSTVFVELKDVIEEAPESMAIT